MTVTEWAGHLQVYPLPLVGWDQNLNVNGNPRQVSRGFAPSYRGRYAL